MPAKKKTVKPKKKIVPKKKTVKSVKVVKKQKAIGAVTHFFGHIEVAIVKFKIPMRVGTKVHFRGVTTDFEETIKSMQYEHKPVQIAKKGQEVGIKVGDKVREGDEVYPAEK